MRGMMFAVAMIAVLLSLWIPTLQLGIQAKLYWWTGFLVFAEAIVVYYLTLFGVIARGLFKPGGPNKRLSRLLVFGPVIVILVILYLSVLLDSLARLPWT